MSARCVVMAAGPSSELSITRRLERGAGSFGTGRLLEIDGGRR
jgi:hypothetical protein